MEAMEACLALLVDRMERNLNVSRKDCPVLGRTCRTGFLCFSNSRCEGFLREDSLVEVRELPVTMCQSESPNEAGNT